MIAPDASCRICSGFPVFPRERVSGSVQPRTSEDPVMIDKLKRAIKKVAPFAFLEPEYVGGLWDEIGQLQFDFLVAQGMQPHHFLLDIACGALRLGVKAIPYLDRAHYLGIDKEAELIRAGLEEELPAEVRTDKAPRTLVSDDFEFGRFDQQADYAIAQSLFSHFPPPMIHRCFARLRDHVADDGVFFATYFETSSRVRNPDVPHDHGYFAYTRQEMLAFGEDNGFSATYIGDWNHPRQQVIVAYRKRA
jgi:hypothetical protein